jgi:hypothetical protein
MGMSSLSIISTVSGRYVGSLAAPVQLGIPFLAPLPFLELQLVARF